MRRYTRFATGDTIVELMLAFTIFSVAAVAALSVMNQGIALSQHSLEVTLVRQQMDGQAETIRYLRDTSDPLWDTIKSLAVDTQAAPLSPSTCPGVSDITAAGANLHGFFIGRDAATGDFLTDTIDATNFDEPTTYARVDAESQHTYGLWVQAVQAENGGKPINAYDIYIHACWDSVAMKHVPATLGTIVRIYDR